ncbi:MAG: phospholipid carrier-dependent glycosyltransferase [Parcubacteria group bacterium]|nr:phospholipid carrier-dependent glycosyltransferase [Parcubacteria group bacterium]
MSILLVAGGLATRFLFIGHPNQVVFDEVHFGKFVSGYFTHEYFFDIHPPLGKLLIALAAWVGKFNAGFSFADIGDSYGDLPYIALRFLPNLAGAFIPIVAFWFFRELSLSKPAAFFGGAMLLLDNALLVQSHFILVDAFLIVLGFLGLASFFRARHKNYQPLWVLASAFFLTLSFSVKWTGLSFFVGALFVVAYDSFGDVSAFLRAHWKVLVSLLFVPIVIYPMIFWVHFALLTKSGPGDPFMSKNFQQKGFVEKFVELNAVMFNANATLNATHPYASKPLEIKLRPKPMERRVESWLLMTRPPYYWVKNVGGGATARIYLLGNPVVWWGSTIFGVAAFLLWRSRQKMQTRFWLGAFWAMHVLPFFFISRVLFLYHYLPALTLAVGLWAWWVDGLGDQDQKTFSYVILALAVIGFIFFAPLSYGFPLSELQYKMRVWFPSWM